METYAVNIDATINLTEDNMIDHEAQTHLRVKRRLPVTTGDLDGQIDTKYIVHDKLIRFDNKLNETYIVHNEPLRFDHK